MLLRPIRSVSAIVWLALNPDSRAQSPARPEFEVASIKPHPASGGPSHSSMTTEHGRITYTNVTVRACIRKAYGLKVYPLSKGSDELSTDRYDIVATTSGDASQEQIMRMLQTLLEDRFKLVLHRETKELRVYALTAGKKPKIHPAQDDGSEAKIGSREGHQLTAHHISMALLASALSGYLGDPVVDATELKGIFDLSLDFTLDESISSDAASSPPLFEAVQQQLGPKLEARRGPVEVIVIDHVQRPSEN